MPGDYSRLIQEIKNYSLSEFLRKELPGIQFVKEKGGEGTAYLKTKCVLAPSISKVPTFYIDKVHNLFFCYDCGALGGIVNLLDVMGHDDASAFRKIEGYINIRGSLSEETKRSILVDIWKDEELANIYFDDTFLEGKELKINGRWRKC